MQTLTRPYFTLNQCDVLPDAQMILQSTIFSLLIAAALPVYILNFLLSSTGAGLRIIFSYLLSGWLQCSRLYFMES